MGYSNYDVAHRWMSGQGVRCQGSNMFFEGDVIYSYGYHFVIARKWNGVILWNDDTYSNSTSKHQGYVRSAAWGKLVDCAVLKDGVDPASNRFYEENMKMWAEKIQDIIESKLSKARKPEKYFNEILTIVDKAERLCEVLDRKLPKELKAYRDNTLSRDELVKKVQEDAKKRAAAAERKRKKAEKEAIERFLEGKTRYANTKYQICRLNTEKNRFETSLGVEIPFEIGRRFYEQLKAGVVKVGDKLLYYTVRHIGKEIEIGCHTFERKYLMEYGKKVFNN